MENKTPISQILQVTSKKCNQHQICVIKYLNRAQPISWILSRTKITITSKKKFQASTIKIQVIKHGHIQAIPIRINNQQAR